jgi:adenine deaminase
MTNIHQYIKDLPKAELHLHIEGSFEPELMFKIAERNNIKLKFTSVEELCEAYQFTQLQDFLDLYYAGMNVLIEEQDFYDLTWNYLVKARENNIIHAEIMFDPQAHTERGVLFGTVIQGISRALNDGQEKLGITSVLIMSFLRHLSEEEAFRTLEESLPYRNMIVAVGLDSSERGNPPGKFEQVFAKAREYGFLTVAHAGEEGPPENIWGAIDLLHVSRIDHGNSSMLDSDLIGTLAELQIPLTVCPLSNLRLQVVDDLALHPLKKMLDLGLLVTVNSDDPAYFGGYLNDNFVAVALALSLTKGEIAQLAVNSFQASFLPESIRQKYISLLDGYYICENS